MATKDQYEFFKFLYEEEERRAERLEKRATFYFTVISAFLGALLFNAAGSRNYIQVLGIQASMLNLVTAFLFAAFACVISGMFFRKHHHIVSGKNLSNNPDSKETNESIFFDQCIEQCNRATYDYQQKNKMATTSLIAAAAFLTGAIIVLLSAFVLGSTSSKPAMPPGW